MLRSTLTDSSLTSAESATNSGDQPMSESNPADDWNSDELYTLAQEAEIKGRGDMNKDALYAALSEEAPHLLTPFAEVSEVEVGDKVHMNHLSSALYITAIKVYDGGDTVQITDDEGSRTEELESSVPGHTVVELVTNRGGRHALVCHKDTAHGPTPWTNGEDAHLRRWRAGDERWMNNSTDPVFFRAESDEEDEDE